MKTEGTLILGIREEEEVVKRSDTDGHMLLRFQHSMWPLQVVEPLHIIHHC